MASFLAGLGAFGAGLGPQLGNLASDIQNNRANSDFGNALASLYGGQTTQAPSMPQASMQQVPTPQVNTQPATVSQPNMQRVSTSSIPTPQINNIPTPQINMGTTTPSLPGGIPQSGQATQSVQAQLQPSPQLPQPQPSQGQPQARPQPQQDQNLGQGPLDLPTLVRNLVKQGVTGARLGQAVQKFTPLLNAQGLQQYHQLGLQLREEQLNSLEAERAWNQNPNAKGSPAQNRIASQQAAQQRISQGQQRIDAVQSRFEQRERDALDKLSTARSDKEALQAKQDLDKIATAKKAELQAQLSIVNSLGTSDGDKQAAAARVKELNQQLQNATDEAIKARRAGAKTSTSETGTGSQRAEPEVVQGKQVKHAPGDIVTAPDGRKYRFKGGDWDSRESFDPVQ